MDELLELMEETPPLEENPPNSNDGGMDELLSLIEENEEERLEPSPTTNRNDRRTTVVTPSNASARRDSAAQSSAKSKKAPSKPVSAGIDDKLGIRMIERNVSSVDLIDLVSMNPYHSPATLSAMSLAGLNRLLIDPPSMIDQATVCGKTAVLTIGVVFSNTGTRISSKGGAFCVLTIGNFVAGPCVSVMLFGELYSKFCRACVPGKVVALVNPNLMPVQPGSGKTSITFSVYGASQLLMVARAMDYGTCKATVRVKDSDGKWTPSGKCKNFIDKRKCDFCDVHRKQQQQKNSNGSNGSLQKLRDQQLGFVPNQQGNPASNNRFLNPGGTAKAPIGHGRCVPLQMQKTLPANSQSRQNETTSSNRLLNGARTTNPGITSRQKECTSSNRLLNTMRTTNRGAANITTGNPGTAKAARVTPATQTRPKRKTGFVGTAPLRGNGNVDWFQEASAPVASNSRGTSFLNAAKKKKRRTINVGGGGFDGSVQVPKQSRLFQSKAPNTISKATPSGPSPQQAAEARHKILQNQAVVATLLKQSSTNPYSNKNGKTAASTATKKTVSGSFYDGLGDVNLEKANNTKSRFATEVEAEEYAKSRQKVVALEKLETSKEKKKKAGKENRFMTHYVCQTCGNRSAQNPKSCVAAGHQVVKSRSLTESESKTEKRTSLHQKSATDGGLRLGAGNEWSRNLKDFHS